VVRQTDRLRVESFIPSNRLSLQERKIKSVLLEKGYKAMLRNDEFNFLAERKKFLDNSEQSKRIREKMLAMTEELRRLYEELSLARRDTQSLNLQLNSIALEFDLQTVPIKSTQH
jgi:hypothetical protein